MEDKRKTGYLVKYSRGYSKRNLKRYLNIMILIITALLTVGCETEKSTLDLNMTGYIVAIQDNKYLIVQDIPINLEDQTFQAPEAIWTTIDNKTSIFAHDKKVSQEALSIGTEVVLQSTRGDIHKSYPALAVANEVQILPDPLTSSNITRSEAINSVLNLHSKLYFIRNAKFLEDNKQWSIEIAPLGDFTEDDILIYHVDGMTGAIPKP